MKKSGAKAFFSRWNDLSDCIDKLFAYENRKFACEPAVISVRSQIYREININNDYYDDDFFWK